MIANCTSCGTHYKHEPPRLAIRGRCGQCAAAVDLGSLRPYRIVTATKPRPADAERAARYSPIGLDHPALATEIARNVAPSAIFPSPSPLPTEEPMAKPVVQPVETFADRKSAGRRAAWFVLWVAAGTGAGSLLHGTLGGTTSTDMALGAMLGVVVGWGWLRWTSPK